MASGGFYEFKYWSPLMGCDAARIYMFDGGGREFFMIVPDDGGKVYRQIRDAAILAIETAIELGLEPGEVRTKMKATAA